MMSSSGISRVPGIHAGPVTEVSVDVSLLAPGTLLEVETKSRTYHLECLGGNSVRISGHPNLCPTPTPAQVQGAVNKEGSLEFGRIERGSRLMFFLNGNRPVNTSAVVKIHITQPPSSARVH